MKNRRSMRNRELLAELLALGCRPLRATKGSHQMWAAPDGSKYSVVVKPHADATKQLAGVCRWLRAAGCRQAGGAA